MILTRYILRNHIVPFVFSLISLMGIFLLQFLMKFSDRLVGKGLDTWVIFKLIAFNLAWMVVLVVPMATLIATLMAYGNMSQNNEITILKSSGVSLFRMIIGPVIVSIILAYLLFLFNNEVLPDANHSARLLMEDISRQKPTLSLEPGVFSQEVNNYAILAREINQKTNTLENVVIYDYSDPTKIDVVTAKKGKIYFSKDQTKLIMDLWDGEIHESSSSNNELYRKIIFKKHRITMNGEQFSLQQSAPGEPRGDRELDTQSMMYIVDSLDFIRNNFIKSMSLEADRFLLVGNSNPFDSGHRWNVGNRILFYQHVLAQVNTSKNIILGNYRTVLSVQDQINSYMVEIHKKYAIPVACFVFILIGAPLGVMVRKGGFGVAASISLFFFVVYWAFLIAGEKLADRNIISPFWGMWSANILLFFAGLMLTTKTVQESVHVDFTFMKKIIPKQWRSFQEESIEE
jgi:lipopolysaccharide export system permease protein